MVKRNIITLFAALYWSVSPIVGQQLEKRQQDVQKEKGWSGLQMPSWVFSSIGVFIQ